MTLTTIGGGIDSLQRALKNDYCLADGDYADANGSPFTSVQDAQDAADSWVFVPPATFSESVTIDTAGLLLFGAGRNTLIDGGTTGDAITVTVADVVIENLSVQTTAGQGNAYSGVLINTGADAVTVRKLFVRDSDEDGITVDAGNDHVLESIRIESADVSGIALNSGVRHRVSKVFSDPALTSNTVDNRADDVIIEDIISNNPGARGVYINGNDTIRIGLRVISAGDDGTETNGIDNILANSRISDSVGSDHDNNGTATTVDDVKTGAAN